MRAAVSYSYRVSLSRVKPGQAGDRVELTGGGRGGVTSLDICRHRDRLATGRDARAAVDGGRCAYGGPLPTGSRDGVVILGRVRVPTGRGARPVSL